MRHLPSVIPLLCSATYTQYSVQCVLNELFLDQLAGGQELASCSDAFIRGLQVKQCTPQPAEELAKDSFADLVHAAVWVDDDAQRVAFVCHLEHAKALVYSPVDGGRDPDSDILLLLVSPCLGDCAEELLVDLAAPSLDLSCAPAVAGQPLSGNAPDSAVQLLTYISLLQVAITALYYSTYASTYIKAVSLNLIY